MHDRGKIKGTPINSVIDGNEVIKEIYEEKSRRDKPVLSEDQLEELESTILEVFNNQSVVEVIFYKNNHFNKIKGIITKVDTAQKKITINNKNSYYFANIIKIIVKNA